MQTPSAERIVIYLLIVASFAIYAFHSSSMFEYSYDDAFISFRYAENLANGHGLVYNVGERVEGYTNFLWTVILALAIRLGADPYWVSKILGVIFALLTMGLSVPLFVRATGTRRWQMALPMLFLACSAPFVAWAQWGLEGGMFTFFAFLGVFLFIRALQEGRSFAFCSISFAVATLTRPEGIIFFAVCVGYYLFLVLRAKRLMASTPKSGDGTPDKGPVAAPLDLARRVLLDRLPIRLSQLIVPFALIYGVYYGWRFSYYGYPFPNTYYVRMAGSLGAYLAQWGRGLKYIFDFSWRGGGAVIVVMVALLWVAYRPAKGSVLRFLSIFAVVPILYSMHVGGDSKHLYRLLMPYLPILYILCAAALGGIFRIVVEEKSSLSIRRIGCVVFTVFVALLLAYTYYFPTLHYFAGGQRATPTWALLRGKTPAHEAVLGFERQKRLVGEWLRKHAPRGTTLATTVAGVTPYYSKLYTYDMLGVTNEHIAHTEPQPHRNVSVDVKATFPDRAPDGVVENILITSHLKSDNEYVIRMDPTLVLEGYDIAFKNAGYKRFRMPTSEFTQYYWARREVSFLP